MRGISGLSEGKMSTMSLEIASVTSQHKTRWTQVKHCVAEWRRRVRSRRELAGLDQAYLADIGVSRCTAAFEASKPFWMA
jgi:uncharacterized protein YjiS (DUF1127 family)